LVGTRRPAVTVALRPLPPMAGERLDDDRWKLAREIVSV
jgi:hypothetical protein